MGIIDSLLGKAPTFKEFQPGLPRKTVLINEDKWNELHTYSFSMVLADKDGSVPDNFQPVDPDDQVFDDTSTYPNTTHVDLQIPPSALSVSLAFTSHVAATNRGVLEENNGVTFRMINISGTTGIYPIRESSNSTQSSLAKGVSILAPQLGSALDNLSSSVQKVASSGNFADKLPGDVADLNGTGYKQFWILHNFFIEYAEAKKGKSAGPLRLVFNAIKDNISYICTPVSFDLRRDASNPLQYKYSIYLKCWDITTAANLEDPIVDSILPTRSNSLLGQIASRIQAARSAISSAGNVLLAAQSDILNAVGLINQATLAVKDIVGVGASILDFLPTLGANISLMVKTNQQQWAQIVDDHAGSNNIGIITNAASTGAGASGAALNPSLAILNASSGSNNNDSTSNSTLNSTLTNGIQNGSPTGEATVQDLTSPAAEAAISLILNDPATADTIPLSDLGALPTVIQKQVDAQTLAAQNTTANQIYQVADSMKAISENFAVSTGSMDATYANIYGLPAPIIDNTKQPSYDDIILQAQIEDGRDAFLGTLATGTIWGQKKDNPFDDANNYLPDTDQVITPRSAFPVFVTRGSSLDNIAKTYLGDPNRAKEIAILNELRAPYIDDDGFQLAISLATGRSFIVNDASNLEAGQNIQIFANGIATSRRRILSIVDLGGSEYKIIVDGNANLDIYTAIKSPYMVARLPGCVGYGDTVLIPSQAAFDPTGNVRDTSLLDQLTYAEKLFKVDILEVDGDFAIGGDGDLVSAYGYQNAIQALQNIVETEQGELEQHLKYGIATGVGDVITGSLISNIQASIQKAVTSDPRFTSADVTAVLDGTALRIRIEAYGSSGTGLIAVEFKVAGQ